MTLALHDMEIREEAREEGLEKGREEGEDKASFSYIQKLMQKMKLSAKGAMDFLDISAEDQEKYAPLLKEASDYETPSENN